MPLFNRRWGRVNISLRCTPTKVQDAVPSELLLLFLLLAAMPSYGSKHLTQPVRLLLWPQWLPVAAELNRPLDAVRDYFHTGSCRGMAQLHLACSAAASPCACCAKPPTCVTCLVSRVHVVIRMGLTNELVLREWLDTACNMWSLLTMIKRRTGHSRLHMKLMTDRGEVIDDKVLTVAELLERGRSRLRLRLVLGEPGCSNPGCPGRVRARVLRCAGCVGASYCGLFCQQAHWLVHKFDCKRQVLESD